MEQYSYKKNRFHIKKEQSPTSSTLLQLRGSMILGPKFDIKKYLNNINTQQKSARKERPKIPLLDNLYKRAKNDDRKYEVSTIINENILSHRYKLRNKKPSIDISTTISYNNNNSNSIKKNKNSSNTLNTINVNNSIITDNFKLNRNSSRKSYLETDTNSGNGSVGLYKKIFENNEEKFNFAHTIKKIKKFAELSRKDKTIKNIMDSKVAYDPKNLDVIFRPIKIINDYKNYQQQKLNENKSEVSPFITENNEIAKNNLIIKVLEKQKNEYKDIINEHQKTIDNNRRVLELHENNFSTYVTNQKIANRKIDDLLTKLIIANRILIREKYILRSEVRVKEDERQKLLERIDELMVIAKFVTRVLEYNSDIFNKRIIPEYSSERLPNYELIAKELFERFSFFLNEKEKLNENDKNMIEQITQLNDSELLYKQFYKIEEDIINTLKNKEAINKEIVDIKKEGIKQIRDIHKRIEDLESELNLYKSLYEREEKEYEEIYKRNYSGEGEFDDIIKELYLDIMNIENNLKNKKNIVNISKTVIDIKKEIIGKENKINKLLMDLEQYEKEDKHSFDRALCNRKNEIKEMKVSIIKNKKKEVVVVEKKENIKPEEKIIFLQRKCEPPYHAPKKEKKEKIDHELIKRMENEELITFE